MFATRSASRYTIPVTEMFVTPLDVPFVKLTIGMSAARSTKQTIRLVIVMYVVLFVSPFIPGTMLTFAVVNGKQQPNIAPDRLLKNVSASLALGNTTAAPAAQSTNPDAAKQ